MVDKKYILFFLLTIKYTFLLNNIPFLESQRYLTFFTQCNSFEVCINPYSQIQNISDSFLTFPYSNVMYFVLLPFYFLGSLVGISFVNLSYLFFEIVMFFVLHKVFIISYKNLYFLVIFNPLIIYSIGFLGQLDLIPLTFFLISLYYLKIKNKFHSLFYIILAYSTKIIFIILLPIFVLYFLKLDENKSASIKTLAFTFCISLLINFQLIFDNVYFKTVLYGISKGYEVINTSISFLNNAFFLASFILFLIFLLFWNNIHRLDFVGLCIFMGLLTFPLFLFNTTNLGWALWSLPSFFIIFYSFGIKVKFLIYFYFIILIVNNELTILSGNPLLASFVTYTMFFLSGICVYFFYKILVNNLYFKIKSKPILLAISGDSAVGKTTISNSLEKFFGKKFVDKLELDSFHLYERNHPKWEKFTHLNPKMNNLQEFKNSINEILNGKTTLVKNYNHLTGQFDSVSKKQIKNFLIVEGLHSLYFDELNNTFDLKVFLEMEEELKYKSKLERDQQRGKSKDKIMKEFEQRKNDYIKYIKPQEESADLCIKILETEGDEVKFSIKFQNDYFYDFQSLVDILENVHIENEKLHQGKVLFNLIIEEKEVDLFFNTVTKNITNLMSNNFKLQKLGASNYSELSCKLAVFLFLLDKKLQVKI